MPRRCGGTPARSLPSSSTRPASGRCSPAMTRSSVVFPEPLGPSTVTTSPVRDVERRVVERLLPVELDRHGVDAKHQNHPPRRTRTRSTSEHGDDGHGHEHDRERVRLRDVHLARPPEEAEDRDGKRRPVGPREEHGRAELAERDRECEPGRDGEPARHDRQVDLATHPAPATRRAARRPRAVAGRSSAASARRSARRRGSRRAPARRGRATALLGSRAAPCRTRSGTRARASRPKRRAGGGRGCRRARPRESATANAARPPTTRAISVAAAA